MNLQPTNKDENINTKLELNVIDYYCTFEYLLKYADINFPDYTSTCFCPFHENINTRAAKVFCEEHNEHLFCFAENKLYRPHHLLTKNIVPFTVSHVFSAIWTNLSNEEKSIFSTDLKYHRIEVDFSKYYSDYRKCKLSYFNLLDTLKNS